MFSFTLDERVNFLLQLSDEYQEETTLRKCETFLLNSKPSMDNLLVAEWYNLHRLKSRTMQYASDCPWEDLQSVIGCLRRDTLERIVTRREKKRLGIIWDEESELDSDVGTKLTFSVIRVTIG